MGIESLVEEVEMERRIGETFWDNGDLIKVESADSMSCKGCYYAERKGKKLCFKKHGYVGECIARAREDKTNVIFVCIK